jgi:uncharacterized protein RhaS with RHS repeats
VPGIGRFASRDPSGFVDGVNLYAYVRNNPVNYVDPTGLYAAFSSQISGGTSGSGASKGATVALDAFYAGGGANQATGQQNLGTMADGGQGDSSNGPVKLAMGPLLPLIGLGLMANEIATSDVPIIGGGAAKGAAAVAKETANVLNDVLVIGRQVDTAVAKDWAGHTVVDIPNWTATKNDQLMSGAIRNRQTVYVGSPQNAANLWDSFSDSATVFARELKQFLDAGYRQIGDYLHPPSAK